MPITSFGFGSDSLSPEGEIGAVQWAQMASYLGAQYSVIPPGVSGALNGLGAHLPSSGDRRVDIASGAVVAYGTYSISSTIVPVSLPAAPSGTRWHIVGIKRDWLKSDDHATIEVLGQGSTIAGALATLTHNPGVRDDQPLWAAQVTAGNSGITGLVDLRVWGAGAQLIAHSTEVLGYLDRRGTEVRIGDVSFTRTVDENYNGYWSDSRRGTLLGSHPGQFIGLPPSGLLGSGVQVWGNARQVVGFIDVPDPGVPWRFAMHAQAFMGSERGDDGTTFRYTFEIDDTEISAHIASDGDAGFRQRKSLMSLPSNQIFTGAKRVHLMASRRSGSGYGAIIPNDRGLRAVVFGA